MGMKMRERERGRGWARERTVTDAAEAAKAATAGLQAGGPAGSVRCGRGRAPTRGSHVRGGRAQAEGRPCWCQHCRGAAGP